MPLDQYKTQVLLLHSEQSTLDSLSSGFSDNYTVHCATSGSEALNTLVETPINIIVTAQDLPGMSGLDALREAKKRSPETIGILLAGESGNDVQALVGEEEVFQVVTGSVTSDSLSQLVDNATRQMRLMALAGAANDTVASVDEPAEHIIMETSDNGSTIISSGMTGQVPALDPKKISAAANVGSRSVDILVLTKDQEFLETVKDSSKGMHKVFYANTLAQANDAIAKHKIGVAVVDAAMVGEKIEQLTQHLRKGSPRLVSIVAGRRDDGEMLMDLINRGKVYRFLLKPVSPGRARLAVEASVKHHLEAPDAAFQVAGSKAQAATPAKSAAPVAKPAAAKKPAPVREPKAAPKPVAKQEKTPAKAAKQAAPIPAAPADPPLGSDIEPPAQSPIDEGLADAFGQDDTSFTETVTGLISSVAGKFSAKDDNVETDSDAAPTPEPTPGKASGSGGSPFPSPKVLGIGAGVLVVVAVIGFWFLGGSPDVAAPQEETLAVPKISEADVVFEQEQEQVAPQVNVDAILDEARLARDAGQVFNPVGSNAIELFAEALAADPENASIAAELDAVITAALGMSETALLESRLDDADAALQRVASVDPEHARLPFLTAQLAQIRLRAYISDARAAIRETRFEDAANTLEIARTIAPADNSEIDAVMEELRAARSEQQVDEVLAMAALRLDSGQLLQPANDNARYYYQLVLSNDAGNTAARQGLSVISSKLVLQARTEIENGNLNEAEDILADAEQVDPANADVSATLDTLAGIRAANAERERRAEAERLANDAREAAAAEAERIAAAERKAKADRLAAIAQLAEEGTAADTNETPDDAAETGAVTQDRGAATPVAAQPAPATNTPLDVPLSGAAGFQPAAGGNEQAARPEPRNALEPAAEMPVAISSLNRIRYVAPKYPRNAQRRNQSGWVDVVFTVTVDGTVRDVEVRGSEPGEVFVNAAIKAVEKWEFEPVVQYGLVVERRAGVRMMFELE